MSKRVIHSHRPVALISAGRATERRGRYHIIRPNGTDDWLLIMTLSGQGRFGFPGGAHLSGPGDLTIYRPAAAHDYSVGPDSDHWQLIWSHFHPRPHWHDWLAWPSIHGGLLNLRILDPGALKRMTDTFVEVQFASIGPPPHARAMAMNALERLLIDCDAHNPRSNRSRFDTRVRAAMEFLCRNLDQRITITDIARASHLSPSRLAHLFREQVGLTPQQFLEQQRLDRARELLEFTPHPVSHIAEQVGYQSPFYFSRRFAKATGLSPREYRRRNGPDLAETGG